LKNLTNWIERNFETRETPFPQRLKVALSVWAQEMVMSKMGAKDITTVITIITDITTAAIDDHLMVGLMQMAALHQERNEGRLGHVETIVHQIRATRDMPFHRARRRTEIGTTHMTVVDLSAIEILVGHQLGQEDLEEGPEQLTLTLIYHIIFILRDHQGVEIIDLLLEIERGRISEEGMTETGVWSMTIEREEGLGVEVAVP
jgi:hypothetical protein